MAEEDLGLDEDYQRNRRVSAAGFGSQGSMITGSIRTSLPLLKINVPLSLSTHDVFQIFSSVSSKEKFQIIEMEENIATAVNKEPFSLRKMFLKCLPFVENKNGGLQTNSPISAVRLYILVNDIKGCRKITLKGLYGDSELLKRFFAQFRQKLQSLVKKEGFAGEKGSSARGKRQLTQNRMTTNTLQNDDSDEENELRMGKYTETSSVY